MTNIKKHKLLTIRSNRFLSTAQQRLIISLLEKSIDVNSKTECWNWTRGFTQSKADKINSYPSVAQEYLKKLLPSSRMHRLVAMIAHPADHFDGALCLHSCHNPSCVNPNHLRWGTPQDNATDRTIAGHTKGGNKPKVPSGVRWQIYLMRNKMTIQEQVEKFELTRPAIIRYRSETPKKK